VKLFLALFINIYIRFTNQKVERSENDSGWRSPINDITRLKIQEKNTLASKEVVLGISSYYHDSSCSIIINGKVSYAAQEERFTREKNTSAFPHHSLRNGLITLGLEISDVTKISYFENPELKYNRIKQQIHAQSFVSSYKLITNIFWRLWKFHIRFRKTLNRDLLKAGFSRDFLLTNPVIFSNHHLSHALSAYVPSQYLSANVIVIDAVGEYATTSIWKANGNSLQLLKYINFPNSIGMLYSAITYFCGFKVNSGEYKLMGLAPYGEPKYTNLILSNLIDIAEDASYRINDEFLTYFSKSEILNEEKFEGLLGFSKRSPESEITQEYMDLAASMQEVLNIYLEKLSNYSWELNPSENLCLAGGVALNCVTNGHIDRSTYYENIWIQPAAGDAGTSLGAAFLAATNEFSHKSTSSKLHENDGMHGAFLGTAYSDSQIEKTLMEYGFVYEKLSSHEIYSNAAQCILKNSTIGWFQGRMEFGPRSLGARSILANPTDPQGQTRINLKIKYRESFRPFAPAMLKKNAITYFEKVRADKYMLFVSFLKPEFRFEVSTTGNLKDVALIRSAFPSITHVDYSARVQVVDQESPLFELLEILSKYDIPMVVNTSFNVRGEPIVESPKDALFCFMATDLDFLFLGSFFLSKQSQFLDKNIFMKKFEND
jgi:carbamoyltransferase